MVSIDQFKSSISEFSKSNLFEVRGLGGQLVSLLCQDVQFPGIGISFEESKEKSNRPTKVPTGENSEDISLTFLLDKSYTARNFFEDWKNQIITSQAGGEFTVGYFDDIKRSFEIWQLDAMQSPTNGILIYDSYPTTISTIDFSSTSENTIGTFNVTLSYQYYQFI